MPILANNRLDLPPQGMLFLQLTNSKPIPSGDKREPGLPGQDFLHSENGFGKFV
jgi:hypothetical protein